MNENEINYVLHSNLTFSSTNNQGGRKESEKLSRNERNETPYLIDQYLNTLLLNDNNKRTKSTNSKEIDLYHQLIQNSETQISTLKSLLTYKNNELNILVNKKEEEESSTNESSEKRKVINKKYSKEIEEQKRRYQYKIDEIKKENSYLDSNLQNEYEYFKNKLEIRKNNLIDINIHQKQKNEIALAHQQESLEVLDKLLYLKNIINECQKYIDENLTKSSYTNTMQTIDNNNTVRSISSSIDYNKLKQLQNKQ